MSNTQETQSWPVPKKAGSDEKNRMDCEWEIKHNDRIEMRKLEITADLKIKSESGNITIKNNDKNIFIDINSSSAVIFPLRTLLKLKKHISFSRNVNQTINVIFSENKVITIENGQINNLKKGFCSN